MLQIHVESNVYTDISIVQQNDKHLNISIVQQTMDSVLNKLELTLNKSFDCQTDTKNWQGTLNGRTFNDVIQFKS